MEKERVCKTLSNSTGVRQIIEGLVESLLSAGEDEKALDETAVGQTRSLSAHGGSLNWLV